MTEHEYKQVKQSFEEEFERNCKALDLIYSKTRSFPVVAAPEKQTSRAVGCMAVIRFAIEKAGMEFTAQEIIQSARVTMPEMSRSAFDSEIYVMTRKGLVTRISKGHYRKVG